MQVINLYLPEFQPKRELLSLLNAIIALVIFISLLGFVGVNKASEIRHLKEKISNLEVERFRLNGRVAILKNTPLGDDRTRIESRIIRARAAIENRYKIQQIMTGQSLGNEKGFSSFMDALSKYSIEGLFLEQFALTQGGKFAQFKGLSKKPEYVPLYISRLQKDSVFSDTKFGSLSIESSGRYVEFRSQGSAKESFFVAKQQKGQK